MPQTRILADALGVVTISLVAVLILLGLFCILYSFYFRNRIQSHGIIHLGYFSGPWVIRITFILFSIWWGFGEILRLNLLRYNGRLFNTINLKWQENVCKCYIVSNMGFAEPCFFLSLAFLLRASLQKSGTLSQKWNSKTCVYVFLFSLPLFLAQMMVILFGPKFHKEYYLDKLPYYFIRTTSLSKTKDNIALCTYPLFSTIILGLFSTILTTYLFWIGRRILHLVINKALQKRVYTLILVVSGLFPLRVVLLGLSVLSKPEDYLFETLAFMAFLSLLCCVGVGICMLVYFPVADSLALGDLEEANEIISLIANGNPEGESMVSSPVSSKCGSISFRGMEKEGAFVELSIFSQSQDSSSGTGWPMLPTVQAHGP